MIALLRNCAHGSEVATWVASDERGRRYVKVALTEEGRAALRSEAAGWRWYDTARRATRTTCNVVRNDPHVVRIEILEVPGRAARAADGISGNSTLLERTLHHYCATWTPTAAPVPLHGDLSFDNVIDGPDGPVIIDWEHFQSDAAPWGFDVIYLLCESLYFERLRSGTVPAEAASLAARQLRVLGERGPVSEEAKTRPMRFVTRWIREHAPRWRIELTRHPMKLPVLSLRDSDLAAVDGALASAASGVR